MYAEFWQGNSKIFLSWRYSKEKWTSFDNQKQETKTEKIFIGWVFEIMLGNPFPFLKSSLARFSNVSKENGIVIENHHLLGALATRQQIIDQEEEDKVSPDLILKYFRSQRYKSWFQLIYEKYAANRGSYRSSVSEDSSTETMSSSGNSYSKKNPDDKIDSFSD